MPCASPGTVTRRAGARAAAWASVGVSRAEWDRGPTWRTASGRAASARRQDVGAAEQALGRERDHRRRERRRATSARIAAFAPSEAPTSTIRVAPRLLSSPAAAATLAPGRPSRSRTQHAKPARPSHVRTGATAEISSLWFASTTPSGRDEDNALESSSAPEADELRRRRRAGTAVQGGPLGTSCRPRRRREEHRDERSDNRRQRHPTRPPRSPPGHRSRTGEHRSSSDQRGASA